MFTSAQLTYFQSLIELRRPRYRREWEKDVAVSDYSKYCKTYADEVEPKIAARVESLTEEWRTPVDSAVVTPESVFHSSTVNMDSPVVEPKQWLWTPPVKVEPVYTGGLWRGLCINIHVVHDEVVIDMNDAEHTVVNLNDTKLNETEIDKIEHDQNDHGKIKIASTTEGAIIKIPVIVVTPPESDNGSSSSDSIKEEQVAPTSVPATPTANFLSPKITAKQRPSHTAPAHGGSRQTMTAKPVPKPVDRYRGGPWVAPNGKIFSEDELRGYSTGAIRNAQGDRILFEPSFIEDPFLGLKPSKIECTPRYEIVH